MFMNKKRKVCFVIASRASYGRVKCLLQEIKKNKNLELVIIAAASLLLIRFGKAVEYY
jgi:UDP-N-acetylglucosamine 2-epimerase